MVDPALLLGAAVVKIACKVWLKDNAVAADAAAGVMEIVQAKVSGAREQRRMRRLFEDLEEKAADKVLSGLEVEFRDVPASEREAAALAVADTLDKVELTSRSLFAADLDAKRLFRAISPRGRRFTSTLSRDATELYGRILRDCCAYVIEIADVLPGFEVGVFGEILARQNEILRRVDQRFAELPMRLGGVGAETFEPTYLRLVANQLDKVELFGVTVSDRVGAYPLSVAYVSLSIRSTARPDDAAMSGSVRPERRVTSIEDALGSARRAFIRGEAGSGKTTLLQWLAVRCGRGDFTGPMRGWNGCVPVFIRLRRYSGAELPRPEAFLQDVGGNIAHTMPFGWMHELLATDRAVVLIDGVDELPESQRRRAREWLRELLLTYPKARYVVTSRPAAASDSWLAGEAFEALEIQPMTLADIDAFISHWHVALAEGVADDAERQRIEKSGHALPRTIRTHRHLRMLTVNPLMTALICALHVDRRMQLPHDRMDLYTVALELLLERRDSEREIRSSTVMISRADKALLLEDLAYWLVRNGWSSASEERVLQRLTDKLANMHRVQAEPGEVLSHLLDRSGLLRRPVEGQIDFVHKTFQEFLAARAAVTADDIGVLVQNAHDDQWREVVLMAVAHGRPQQTEELLTGILRRADGQPDRRHVLQALAVGCIQHAPQLPRELHRWLQGIAADLLPPKDMSQAVALAGAGDLVLELLFEHQGYTPREAAATIRLAATIGGDHAMSIIADCMSDDRTVSHEAMGAWPKFDPEDFARQVIAERAGDVFLELEDPSQLTALRHLLVKNLFCQFLHGHGHIDYIRELPELTTFQLVDPLLTSLAPVGEHPNLRSLILTYEGTFLLDISPLGRCPSLRRVNVPLRLMRDHRQLRELVHITELEFNDDAQVDEVLPNLSPAMRLSRIDFWDAWSVDSLDDLLAAEQLAELDFLLLQGAHDLESIAGIEEWAGTMTGIYLHASKLTDVDRLASLTLLEFANLASTPIESLDFLRGSSRLRRLHIGHRDEPVPDLTPLCDLPELRHLHIWGSHPVDLSGLARAGELTVEIMGTDRTVYGRHELPDSVELVRSADEVTT